MKRILVVLSVVALLGACCNHSKKNACEGEKAKKCCEMKMDSTGDGCGKHKADSIKMDSTCTGKEKACCASKDSTKCCKK